MIAPSHFQFQPDNPVVNLCHAAHLHDAKPPPFGLEVFGHLSHQFSIRLPSDNRF